LALSLKGYSAGHCHVGDGLSLLDAKEEIAVPRSSFSCGSDQPGGALVFSISAEPARHRGASVRARGGRQLRDDSALVRQVRRELRASRQGRAPQPGIDLASGRNVRDAAWGPYLLWRAVDQHGAELDVLVQKRRDKLAAKRFFNRVLAACPEVPRKIVTDQLRSYPAARAEIPELANVRHVFVKAKARVNNRAENSHQPTRERERRMRGFRRPERTQSFLSSFGPSASTSPSSANLLRASLYRKQLAARFEAWRLFTGSAQNPSVAF